MPLPLEDTLRRLGLTDYEARIYLVLLARSPTGAAQVARACHLSRSSVYTVLAVLMQKGLVGTTTRNGVKQFVAEDVDALEAMVARERERATLRADLLASVSGALRALRSPTEALLPEVTVFEGQEGLKRIYLSMLRDAPEGATMRILRDEFLYEPSWGFALRAPWRGRVKRVKRERDIRTQLLVNDSTAERERAAAYRARTDLQTRLLPRSQRLERFGLYQVGDVVSLLSLDQQHLIGLRIVNRHIAANVARLFSALWKGATQPRA